MEAEAGWVGVYRIHLRLEGGFLGGVLNILCPSPLAFQKVHNSKKDALFVGILSGIPVGGTKCSIKKMYLKVDW